jgi:hypothetical protein
MRIGMVRRVIVGGAVGVGAMLLVPAEAVGGTDVHIGINIGTPPPPPVVVSAPPQLVVVPRTRVYYAPAVPYNYFYYEGGYYTTNGGVWFYASDFNGPWYHVAVEHVPRRILAVPVAYYKVPPGHMKKHWHGKHRGRRHRKHDD